METAEFIRQAEEFADTLAAKGTRARLAIVPDTNHYTMLAQWRTPGSHLLAQFQSLVEPNKAAKTL